MNRRLHPWGIAIVLLVCYTVACAQNTKPVAVVNGENITQDQLDKAAAPELRRIESKREQYLLGLEREKKKAVEDALEDMVNDKLLATEAKKRSITVDQLVRSEVAEKVQAPSEETVRRFYDDNKAVIKGTFVETALEIRNYLVQQGQDAAFTNLLAKLRKDYGYKSLVEPERAKVGIEGHPSRGPATASNDP